MNDKMIEYNKIKIANCDNLELMASMHDESVDVILTDPPYLYLKNQKLDKVFDENLFFSECKRVLVKDGFIVLFGRGTSFYRWNTMLADLGFEFKEEIVWNKSQITSPLLPISRIHETVSIHTKGANKINKVKVPYLEMKRHDIDSIIQDIKRMRAILKNTKSLNAVLDYLENNQISVQNEMSEKTIIRTDFEKPNNPRKGVTAEPYKPTGDRACNVMQSIDVGMNELSIIRTDFNNKTGDGLTGASKNKSEKSCTVMNAIYNGMNEKTIIKEVRDHYSAIHPTQKPVRLLERLLALVIPSDKNREDITVLDPFGGSFSTMEAVYNMGMKGISCEIDKEYFDLGKSRIQEVTQQLTLF